MRVCSTWLFNKLALWNVRHPSLGAPLGPPGYFLKFYFVCGYRGRAFLTVLFSLLPFTISNVLYDSIVIGRLGARFYGLLARLRWYFPDRPILMFHAVPDSRRKLLRDDHRARSPSTRRSALDGRGSSPGATHPRAVSSIAYL
jgi:hypothetical protein